MKIQVRDKEFEITFFSNWCIKRFNEINDVYESTKEIVAKIRDLNSNDMSTEDRENKLEEYSEKIKVTSSSDFFKNRMELVQEILESNDCEFDAKWWDKKTEPADIINFITASYMKDVKGIKKK